MVNQTGVDPLKAVSLTGNRSLPDHKGVLSWQLVWTQLGRKRSPVAEAHALWAGKFADCADLNCEAQQGTNWCRIRSSHIVWHEIHHVRILSKDQDHFFFPHGYEAGNQTTNSDSLRILGLYVWCDSFCFYR